MASNATFVSQEEFMANQPSYELMTLQQVMDLLLQGQLFEDNTVASIMQASTFMEIQDILIMSSGMSTMPLSLRTSSTTYPCHIPHSTWSSTSLFIFPSECPCYSDHLLLMDYYNEQGTGTKLIDRRHEVHVYNRGHLP